MKQQYEQMLAEKAKQAREPKPPKPVSKKPPISQIESEAAKPVPSLQLAAGQTPVTQTGYFGVGLGQETPKSNQILLVDHAQKTKMTLPTESSLQTPSSIQTKPPIATSDPRKPPQSRHVAENSTPQKQRFLLPVREGRSIERMNAARQDHDDLDGLDSQVLQNKITQDEYNAKRAEKVRKHIDETVLTKKESETQSMLSEILKLKDEIQEVSESFREIDIETRQKQVKQTHDLLQRQIHKKLDTQQASTQRRLAAQTQREEEDYVHSLRQALEEDSEEEEELQRRSLARKKDGLMQVRKQSRELRKAHLQDEEDSEDGSCLYPKKELPARTRLGQSGLSQGPGGKSSKASSHKETDQYPIRKMTSNPKPQARLASLNKQANQKKSAARKNSLETSEEEDFADSPYQAKLQFQRPPAVTQVAKVAGKPIDELSEDQLMLIKQMVDERIEGLHPTKKPQRTNQLSSKPPLAEDDAPAIDDDFYDDKFLNLVYEMESQNEDSHNFFC